MRISRRYWICAMLAGVTSAWLSRGLPASAAGDEKTLGTGSFASLAFSHDGQRLLTASALLPRVAQIWELASGKEVRRFEGHLAPLRSAAFSPDEKYVVTAAGTGTFLSHIPADYSARIWEAATGKELRQLIGHKGFVYSAAFNLDASKILTTGDDSMAILWDAKSGKQLFRFPGIEFQRPALFSPDGGLVSSVRGGDGHYYVQLWDANSGKELRRCGEHDDKITGVQFSPSGELILTASRDSTARIWETATGKERQVLRGHTSRLRGVAFSADGKRAATASEDKSARLWDAETGAEIRFCVHLGPVITVELNRDGSRLLTTSDLPVGTDRIENAHTRVATLWNIETGRQIAQRALSSIYGRDHCTFSPDGNSFFITLHTTAELCRSDTGETVRQYK
ncbi:MAG: WD40 repeat domain-containing protein [Planctomycetaceae bacterium]|nr:WD40 repeat domain-containing protein [Planctomycetaceae bacterium]